MQFRVCVDHRPKRLTNCTWWAVMYWNNGYKVGFQGCTGSRGGHSPPPPPPPPPRPPPPPPPRPSPPTPPPPPPSTFTWLKSRYFPIWGSQHRTLRRCAVTNTARTKGKIQPSTEIFSTMAYHTAEWVDIDQILRYVVHLFTSAAAAQNIVMSVK